jgi:hypothetical protein
MSHEESLNTHAGTISEIETSADRSLRPLVTWAVVRGSHSLNGGAGTFSIERDAGGRRG